MIDPGPQKASQRPVPVRSGVSRAGAPVLGKRLVVPSTSKRDAVIAVACGAVLLALVALVMVMTSREVGKPSTNQLTGTIVAKHASGETEKEISLGRKGVKAEETDSGYSLDVRTEPGGRVYELPVSKAQWQTRKIGEKQSFIRPPSEQR